MNLKKAIIITLFISVFLVGTLGAVNATNKTTTNSKVTKDTLKITAPKVTNTYKKSQNFKITVKNKKTGKAMKNIKATIKIDTKKYNKKTNNKGIININTKTLKPGTHKVVIQIKATKKYKTATTKSSIKIIKPKIKTSLHIYPPEYEYNDEGEFLAVSYKADLLDNKGNRLKKPINVKYGFCMEIQKKSGESFVMGSYEYYTYMDEGVTAIKFIFEGDSKYEACNYTVNLNG